MELFQNVKMVRLRSHHDKYLLADDDQESVIQDRHGTTRRAKWTVEFVETVDNVIRLKSCYGKYLTASSEQYLLGVTGRRVTQTLPRRLDSQNQDLCLLAKILCVGGQSFQNSVQKGKCDRLQVEWEPIQDGCQVKLKTRYGNYLRANGGVPPWRNSITHDIPTRHRDWILWAVDVIETRPTDPSPEPSPSASPARSESFSSSDLGSSSFNLKSPRFVKLESKGSFGSSPTKNEGRTIYYCVMGDDGEGGEETSFQFKGKCLEELTDKLEEETGLEDIIVCSRNRSNGQLYPLRLALPPNNTSMHVVVVPSSSEVASNFVGTPMAI